MLKFLQNTHFALREVFNCLPNKRTMLGSLTVSILIGMQGPFGTFEVLPIYYRVPYFVFMIFSTFIIPVSFFNCFLFNVKAEGSVRTVLIIVFGIMMAFVVASIIYGINYVIWRENDITPTFLQCLEITVPVAILQTLNILFEWFTLLRPDFARPEKSKRGFVYLGCGSNEGDQQKTCAFLKRLPEYLGTELLCLSSKDHFVTAKTKKGAFDIRMRFADALGEVSSMNGIQIHRSHWVAISEIVEIQKNTGKHFIVFESGQRLPVSRGRQAEVCEKYQKYSALNMMEKTTPNTKDK